jgi:hypothetical protein
MKLTVFFFVVPCHGLAALRGYVDWLLLRTLGTHWILLARDTLKSLGFWAVTLARHRNLLEIGGF